MRARRLSRRVEELEAFRGFLSAVGTEIRFAALPVEMLVRRHRSLSPWLAACDEKLSAGEPFPLAWQEAVALCPVPDGDKAFFREFGEGLGTSDVEGQMAHCRLCETRLEELLAAARDDKLKKSKLYLTLGICAGLAAGLVLL